MINQVEMQLQDESGNWRTMAVTTNGIQQTMARMDGVTRQFPGALEPQDSPGVLFNLR
ncbi:MAG: hypothetical protein JW395_3070 [Nitrospira sp.]|nr:hypothetical protein [Nitrospira sp.]